MTPSLDALGRLKALRESGVACFQGGYGCGCNGCNAMDFLMGRPDVLDALLSAPDPPTRETPPACGKQTNGGYVCTLEPGHAGVCLPLEIDAPERAQPTLAPLLTDIDHSISQLKAIAQAERESYSTNTDTWSPALLVIARVLKRAKRELGSQRRRGAQEKP